MVNRLREMREDRDLGQKDLANLLGVHQTTYSSYETGKLGVPVETLAALAEFYKTSVDYILCLTDEPKAYPRSRNK